MGEAPKKFKVVYRECGCSDDTPWMDFDANRIGTLYPASYFQMRIYASMRYSDRDIIEWTAKNGKEYSFKFEVVTDYDSCRNDGKPWDGTNMWGVYNQNWAYPRYIVTYEWSSNVPEAGLKPVEKLAIKIQTQDVSKTEPSRKHVAAVNYAAQPKRNTGNMNHDIVSSSPMKPAANHHAGTHQGYYSQPKRLDSRNINRPKQIHDACSKNNLLSIAEEYLREVLECDLPQKFQVGPVSNLCENELKRLAKQIRYSASSSDPIKLVNYQQLKRILDMQNYCYGGSAALFKHIQVLTYSGFKDFCDRKGIEITPVQK